MGHNDQPVLKQYFLNNVIAWRRKTKCADHTVQITFPERAQKLHVSPIHDADLDRRVFFDHRIDSFGYDHGACQRQAAKNKAPLTTPQNMHNLFYALANFGLGKLYLLGKSAGNRCERHT